jgi:hypothetical protein
VSETVANFVTAYQIILYQELRIGRKPSIKKILKTSLKKRLKALKTAVDLNKFSRMLKKITVETALNADMVNHLDYEKHTN